MPEISKIEVNGVEYDIKDAKARESGGGAAADHTHSWNDLEDRPFYENITTETLLEEIEFTTERNAYFLPWFPIKGDGEQYRVTFDGVEYITTSSLFYGMFPVIGNADVLASGSFDPFGEPFVIADMKDDGFAVMVQQDGTHSLKVEEYDSEFKALDDKFINTDWLAKRDLESIVVYNHLCTIKPSSEFRFYKTYDSTLLDGTMVRDEFKVIFDSKEFTTKARIVYENGSVVIGNMNIYDSSYEDTGEPFYIYLTSKSTIVADGKFRGIYETTKDVQGFVEVIRIKDNTELLPEHFLPESVEGVVIRSSTPGSTKKFVLSVDDTGNIVVTEV